MNLVGMYLHTDICIYEQTQHFLELTFSGSQLKRSHIRRKMEALLLFSCIGKKTLKRGVSVSDQGNYGILKTRFSNVTDISVLQTISMVFAHLRFTLAQLKA